jgi:subtilisin-like proprotein convertase family protein
MSDLISSQQNVTQNVAVATTNSAHVSTFQGGGGNIPDGRDCFTDDIIVNDDFRVSDVAITLCGLIHTWIGDLVVQLHHVETGTVVELFRRPGQPQFSSSGYSNNLNGDYSFNDRNTGDFEAAAGEYNSAIPSGNYAPYSSLSAFYGLSAQGTWRLTISDYFPGDSGSLESWQLDLGWG